MNAYAVVGFVIAFGSCAFYAAYTVLEGRRVAAKVLALQVTATSATHQVSEPSNTGTGTSGTGAAS
jgi:hypothetical protein